MVIFYYLYRITHYCFHMLTVLYLPIRLYEITVTVIVNLTTTHSGCDACFHDFSYFLGEK